MTKIEAAAIKENLGKIKEYVEKNYIPRLRRYDFVSVDFGEIDRNGWPQDKKLKYSFGFNYDGDIWYRCGGLVLSFISPDGYSSHSVFDGWPYAKDLLINWQTVKRKIETEFSRQEEERAALMEFEV